MSKMNNLWDRAPEWANYRAQNKNGKWYWFETKPVPRRLLGKWLHRDPECDGRVAVDTEAYSGWESTLEGRPK